MSTLTHINRQGEANMVDVGDKDITSRTAIAEGFVRMKPETMEMILNGDAKKGDVLGTARLAGIMAVKRTHELIPLCHPLLISKAEIEIEPLQDGCSLRVQSTVRINGQTGVEMEALTGVSIACLTIYDMAKAVDRGMIIENVRVLEKSGGKSGHYKADVA